MKVNQKKGKHIFYPLAFPHQKSSSSLLSVFCFLSQVFSLIWIRPLIPSCILGTLRYVLPTISLSLLSCPRKTATNKQKRPNTYRTNNKLYLELRAVIRVLDSIWLPMLVAAVMVVGMVRLQRLQNITPMATFSGWTRKRCDSKSLLSPALTFYPTRHNAPVSDP